MGKKKKASVQLIILVIISSLIVWHAISWHSIGMYSEMLDWLQTCRGYLTVLYNLGLMLVLGITLGLFMEKITDFFGYEVREIKHLDDGTEHGEKV
ncbi:hypothetical protein ACFLXG_04155 [Chloroflexota bacterium]